MQIVRAAHEVAVRASGRAAVPDVAEGMPAEEDPLAEFAQGLAALAAEANRGVRRGAHERSHLSTPKIAVSDISD